MNLQQVIRAAVCAAIVALCVAGAELFSTQPAAGQVSKVGQESKEGTMQGAAALDHLKRDGQYESLQAAMNQARFGVSHAAQTPLDRSAWLAPNAAAGYDAYAGEATHPLTIDPLFTQRQKLTAEDGETFDHFGIAIALSDDTLVVGASQDNIGANGNQGSVYVFTRSGETWVLQQKLIAVDGGLGDFFGGSVALSGDTLAVGARVDEIGGNGAQGSVYVFTRSGAAWTQQQKLIADDGEFADFFGHAVALDGDTLVVGAPQDGIDFIGNQGSAYVFTRSGATWTQRQKLIADDAGKHDNFGHAIALDGDTLVVGAQGDDIGGNTSQGSAYVFARSGAIWAQQQKLSADDGTAFDSFGWSVALEGDTLVVGAYRDSPVVTTSLRYGSAYIYTRSGAIWTQQQKLTAADGGQDDFFGWSLALDGDTLAVGAYADDIGAIVNQGSAYVFTRNGAIWTQRQKLLANDGEGDAFGYRVALDGDTLAAGAPQDDIGANGAQGSAYVFKTCQPFTLAPASLPNGARLIPYQQSVTVSDGDGPYEFTLGSGALPPGISLASSGLLSGTPTTLALGAYHFTIIATDLSNGCSSSRTYTITVTSCPVITIEPPTLPAGAVGAPYSRTLTATGGRPLYIFSVAKNSVLPPGLILSQSGLLSGAPTEVGSFNFTVLVRDANGCAGSRAYTLTVTRGEVESSVAPRQRN